jgi:fumarate reductase subunit C
MATNWWDSSATFKRGTVEKASFVLLVLFDLTLTVVAMNLGFEEMNPFIRFLIQIPLLLLIVKLFIPLLIAWLMPGRLLLPSIALLVVVVIWNIKELVIFLI